MTLIWGIAYFIYLLFVHQEFGHGWERTSVILPRRKNADLICLHLIFNKFTLHCSYTVVWCMFLLQVNNVRTTSVMKVNPIILLYWVLLAEHFIFTSFCDGGEMLVSVIGYRKHERKFSCIISGYIICLQCSELDRMYGCELNVTVYDVSMVYRGSNV